MVLRSLRVLLTILIFTFVIAACAEQEEDLGDVVAVVNGEEVYESSLNRILDDMIFMYQQQGISFEGDEAEMMISMLREQALNQLIQQTVMIQKAKAYNVLATDQEVLEELNRVKNQFETDAMYQEALIMNSLTEKQLKASIFDNLSMRNLIESEVGEIPVTAEEIEAYYNEYKAEIEKQRAALIDEEGELTEAQEAQFSVPDLAEIKDDIRAFLSEQEQQRLTQKLIEQWLEESTIERFN